MNARLEQPDDSSTGVRAWCDVIVAVSTCVVDPWGLGGLHLRGRPGPVRDRVVGWIRELGASVAQIPLHVTDDRLLGGMSLADTLRLGRVAWERGLLEQADGGLAIVSMAERIEPRVSSQLCGVLDRGSIAIEREGMSSVVPCRIGLLVFDEGIGDEAIPSNLRDRLAFTADLDVLASVPATGEPPTPAAIAQARARLPDVTISADVLDALCRGAAALGITSTRAVVLAARAARVHAALAGRARVEVADLDVAARLVLGPRAVRLEPAEELTAPTDPAASSPEPSDERDASPPPPEAGAAPEPAGDPHGAGLGEIVLHAAKCGIPDRLLRTLQTGKSPRRAPSSAGQSGAKRSSNTGGRPAGTTAAMPGEGRRLAVLETLRAAAPMQRVRTKLAPQAMGERRVQVRREDFRVRRHNQRSETCVIFAVDASGSAALRRLAEAKGAVEQLLSDCYARRDHVALIAFRATQASVVLPPTRSLSRVRKRLGELAGGGTTPLAAGIDAALTLADDAKRRGRTPIIVMLTDGRGNVARDGRAESAAATSDALESSRRVRAAGVPALVLDTSPRSQPRVRALAAEMNARYMPLPYFDPAGVAREVRSLAKESPTWR